MVNDSLLAKIDAFLSELKEEGIEDIVLGLTLRDLWLLSMMVTLRLFYT